MKRITVCLLMITLTVTARADWYGTLYHPSDYWGYVTPERYAGEPYTASLDEMESMREVCPPARLTLSASLEDADRLLREAMRFAPETVVVSLPTRSQAIRYFERWNEPEDIDPIIGAVWTRTSDLYSVRREVKDVIITIPRYSDGWLAFVDTSPQIRCYQDQAYSAELTRLRAEAETVTDAEGACRFVTDHAELDRAEMKYLLSNGFHIGNRDSHCVAGIVKGKAVCDGYVAGAQFVLACVGITSVDIIGIGEVNHAWLKVQTDGGWVIADPMKVGGYDEYLTLNEIERFT